MYNHSGSARENMYISQNNEVVHKCKSGKRKKEEVCVCV